MTLTSLAALPHRGLGETLLGTHITREDKEHCCYVEEGKKSEESLNQPITGLCPLPKHASPPFPARSMRPGTGRLKGSSDNIKKKNRRY